MALSFHQTIRNNKEEDINKSLYDRARTERKHKYTILRLHRHTFIYAHTGKAKYAHSQGEVMLVTMRTTSPIRTDTHSVRRNIHR